MALDLAVGFAHRTRKLVRSHARVQREEYRGDQALARLWKSRFRFQGL